ncbi:hypothetical protein DRW07_05245 [Alteromonas sediminis]|uniref:Uncharacterized protein n=1 Tax=Alteromonas sediminis TaxID=2259342 RepID=A0A3N5Y3X0_9ALTE|nr:hypothetical protein [Alteromonas sediminis]RPJ68797.1 hypothetical protein DRW07_05245 [Alteromonas sediminis]
MKAKTTSIIRKYKRSSRSPFSGDDSTILLLATIENIDSLQLRFDRYVYLHRDDVGRWLGISLSNQLVDEFDDGKGKYRSGIHMIEVLFKLKDEIVTFLAHFSDDISTILGLDAARWLEAATPGWRKALCDAGMISDS